MTPIWAWSRRELLRHRRAALALVLLIGVSGAVVLTAAAGARRTGSAFERFLEASNTADVQLKYSTEHVDDEVLAALHADPDVEQAAPLYLTVSFVEGIEYDLGIFASPDPALFRDIEIPRMVEGRMPDPSAADEVIINRFTQRLLGVEPGDVVTVGTFSAEQFGGDEDAFVEPAGPALELEVTGIGVLAYDLADPEFPGFFGTPAFHEAHWGELGGDGPYVQVTTRPGTDAVEVVDRAIRDIPLEGRTLLAQSQETAKVADSTRVLEVGLWAFAAVAGLAATVVAAQALRRRIAEAASDLPSLRATGLTRWQCAAALALTVLPMAAVGGVLAAILAIAGSAAMPIGEARRAEPSPGIDVDLLALAVGSLVLIALLAASAVLGAARLTRPGSSIPIARPRRPSASLLASGRFSPASQLGVAMALDPGEGRTAVPVRSALVGAVVGVAGIVGAATFGAGLDQLVTDPGTSGWNWTFAPDVDEAELEPLLEVAGVTDVGVMTYAQVEADGEQMSGFSMTAEKGSPSFTIVSGRMPAGPREVAVGPKTAERLDVGEGDAIVLADPAEEDGQREVVVVGEVLMPTFADDNLFNEGLVLSPDSFAAVKQTTGSDQVVVTFADGIDADVAARRVRDVLPDGLPVYAFSSPPPDVANLSGVQFLPRALGLFLGLLALAGIAHALATSVRRRRHDLGIVRSLGFVARDVLRSITALSWTMVAVGLIVGIPLGIAAGRIAWQAVADGIGVRASAPTSPVAMIALAAASLAVGAALSLPAGATAARQRAVDALRVE